MKLSEQIKKQDAKAFTHSGKFHADDVFSSALLLYLNPQITITRGNQVPEGYDGIVFDIGRGQYDHHQRDSRVRENGVPYAAFGLLWEELGGEILGGALAQRFDEEFVQPLDNNDNTGEKNELASLIGNFNPVWDAQNQKIYDKSKLTAGQKECGLTGEFLHAVRIAGLILENKFARYRADARADEKIDQVHCHAGDTGWGCAYSGAAGICSVSETAEGDGYSVCYFPVKSWRILYPATEETGFHELQMQFSKAMAGA